MPGCGRSPCRPARLWHAATLRIGARTDELAAQAYDVLGADELDELVAGLEVIAAAA